MCGQFGTFGIGDVGEVEAGVAALKHRGPDGAGVEASGEAVHGHARLALLDLSDASAQPFRRSGGLLTFVGEVWNHVEVGRELKRLGERFSTSGDTEVVAAALSRWGMVDGLARLDGMFSICWSDGRGGHWLAVDRFGKVPLRVERRGRSFLWSSEAKAMPRPASSIHMPPASLLDLATGKLSRWWSIRDDAEPLECPEEALGLLRRGVRRRLAADAPVCVLCSGGLDSSLILALAAEEVGPSKLTAWTAFLDQNAEDLKWARRFCSSMGVRLEEVRCPKPTPELLSEAFRSIECRMKAQVEIAVPCVALAKVVGRAGFKACLSGEAADELFGGYGSMIIKAAKLDDDGWRWLRMGQVAKMARGNFPRCVAKDSLVMTGRGSVMIQDVVPGDEAWTWDDRKLKLKEIAAVRCNGTKEVVEVTALDRKLRVTEDHLILAVPYESVGKANKCNYSVRWVEVGSLKPKDFLVAIDRIPAITSVPTFGGVSLTEDVAWFLGAYIGDGWCGTNSISFAVGYDAKYKVAADVQKIAKERWNANCSTKFHGTVSVNSRALSRWMYESGVAGRLAADKIVPQLIWESPERLQRAFLRGYQVTDGCLDPKGYWVYGSASKRLIEGIHDLHLSIGDNVSNVYENRRSGFNGMVGTKVLKSWKSLWVTTAREGIKLGRGLIQNRPRLQRNVGEDFTVVRVKSVVRIGKTDVYDLTVPGPENFLVNGLVAHNCNKAFMAGGVECRLPFMERGLVERTLATGKAACPPGKGLLKAAAKLAGVPSWIVDRPKATFQGGSGVAAAAALAVANPTRFYNQESRRIFGKLM